MPETTLFSVFAIQTVCCIDILAVNGYDCILLLACGSIFTVASGAS